MAKKKACKRCRAFVAKGNECPLCKSQDLTTSWKGRVIIFNLESEVAKKMGVKEKGEYAIKIR